MFSPNVSLRLVQPEIMDEQRPWAERPSLSSTWRGWAVLSSRATLAQGNQCLKAQERGGAGASPSIPEQSRDGDTSLCQSWAWAAGREVSTAPHSPTQPHTAPWGRGAWHQAPPQQEIFPSHARLQGAAEQGKGLPWNPQVLGLSSELPLEMGVMTVWHPYGEGRGADPGQDEAAPSPIAVQCQWGHKHMPGQHWTGSCPAQRGKGWWAGASHCPFHQAKKPR